MTNASETVREVYERTVGYNQMCSFGYHEKETVKRIADNFLSAYEREMAAVIAERDAEIRRRALLERALKPVMEIHMRDETTFTQKQLMLAVAEAQRIILEAWDDKNYFWKDNNRVAKKCREVK